MDDKLILRVEHDIHGLLIYRCDLDGTNVEHWDNSEWVDSEPDIGADCWDSDGDEDILVAVYRRELRKYKLEKYNG